MADAQPLSLLFTKTLRFRPAAAPREYLEDPADLAGWLTAAGLGDTRRGDAGRGDAGPEIGEELLAEARELRESIYRAARAVAEGGRPAAADRDHINAWAARHDAVRVLTPTGAAWRLPAAARSALAVLATDAVDTLGGARDGSVKVCSGEGCVAVYLDASRGRTRRWCDMGTCGNRAKKNAMRDRQTGGASRQE